MERLDKKYNVTDRFIVSTKRMTKNRFSTTKQENTYEVLKHGDIRTFQKGKRVYRCKVLDLVETRTGLYQPYYFEMCPNKKDPQHKPSVIKRGNRWYQFSYVVEVIET